MKRVLNGVAALCVLAAMALPAKAALHTFQIVEFFSSADGCVQFIRLHESQGFDFQSFTMGATVTCSNGVTTNTFTFPTNLANTSTANKDVLLATSNFASLPGGVTPDFIIPAGFIFTSGGTLNFSGFSIVPYGPMPTNGQTSRLAGGGTQVNTPRNYSNVSGSVNVPAGSCCVGTVCSTTVQACCSGTFTLGGLCLPNPCAPASGICCAGVTCRLDTPANCTGVNTLFVATPACNGTGNNATPCCRADFHHANGLTVQDIFDFLGLWFASSPTADFIGNGTGSPSVQSIFDFLGAWFAGC